MISCILKPFEILKEGIQMLREGYCSWQTLFFLHEIHVEWNPLKHQVHCTLGDVDLCK